MRVSRRPSRSMSWSRAGFLGRKAGRGFYDYGAGARQAGRQRRRRHGRDPQRSRGWANCGWARRWWRASRRPASRPMWRSPIRAFRTARCVLREMRATSRGWFQAMAGRRRRWRRRPASATSWPTTWPSTTQMSAPCRRAGGYLRRCRVRGGGRARCRQRASPCRASTMSRGSSCCAPWPCWPTRRPMP